MYPSPFAVRCGGGKKVANLMFPTVLVVSPVLVEARIPSGKTLLVQDYNLWVYWNRKC